MAKGEMLWLYYEENYHDAATETAPVTDQTLYENRDDAIKRALAQIHDYEIDGFVLDSVKEIPTHENIAAELDTDGCFGIVMFDAYQENWNCSFSVCITEIMVQ